jgi:hypothetical protein
MRRGIIPEGAAQPGQQIFAPTAALGTRWDVHISGADNFTRESPMPWHGSRRMPNDRAACSGRGFATKGEHVANTSGEGASACRE